MHSYETLAIIALALSATPALSAPVLYALRISTHRAALYDEYYRPSRDNQQRVSDTKLTPFHFQDLVPVSNNGGGPNTQGIGLVRHEQRAPGLEEREELESREPQPIKAGTV